MSRFYKNFVVMIGADYEEDLDDYVRIVANCPGVEALSYHSPTIVYDTDEDKQLTVTEEAERQLKLSDSEVNLLERLLSQSCKNDLPPECTVRDAIRLIQKMRKHNANTER